MRYDGLNVKQFIANLRNEIDTPEAILDIVNYENPDESANILNKNLKKIKIYGNALNDNYAVVALYDINANVIVKNLEVSSSLKLDPNDKNKNTLLITKFDKPNIPSYDKLLAFYPFKDGLVPEFGQILKNDIINNEYQKSLNDLSEVVEVSNSAVIQLSSNVFGENGLLSSLDYWLENPNETIDKETLFKLRTTIDELSYNCIALQALTPETDLSAYIDDNREFDNDSFDAKLDSYSKGLTSFNKSVSAKFLYSGLDQFVLEHPDIINPDIASSEIVTYDDYLKLYFYEVTSGITNAMQSTEIIATKAFNKNNEINADGLSFVNSGELVEFPLLSASGKDAEIEFSSNEKTYNAMEMSGNAALSSVIQRVYMNTNETPFASYLFDAMFNNRTFTTLNERMKNKDSKNPFGTSKRGSTICFWAKPKSSASETTNFISFDFGENKEYKLLVNDRALRSAPSGQANHSDYDNYESDSQNLNWKMYALKIDNIDILSGVTNVQLDLYQYVKNEKEEYVASGITLETAAISGLERADDFCEMNIGYGEYVQQRKQKHLQPKWIF